MIQKHPCTPRYEHSLFKRDNGIPNSSIFDEFGPMKWDYQILKSGTTPNMRVKNDNDKTNVEV